MLEAVLFDLDGVITDTAEYHFQAWKALADSLGIEIDRKFNEQLKGVSRKDSLNRILAYGHKENQYSEEEKEALMKQKNDHYLTMIQKMTPEQILPGMNDLLHDLKNNGIKIVLASASQNGPMILNRLGLDQLFDGIADPTKVAHGKPAPDIYLEAARVAGVCPSHCVGVEDAASGVDAINQSKIVSVAIGDKEELKEADVIVATTAKVTLPLIKKAWEDCHVS